MTPEQQVSELYAALIGKERRGIWERIRGTAIIFGILATIICGLLFTALYWLFQEPEKVEAHWATAGMIIGFIAAYGTAFIQISHMRADESPPQMDVETAIKFATLIREGATEDVAAHFVANSVQQATSPKTQ